VHPETGKPWPPLPDRLLKLWQALLPDFPQPEACLINYYAPSARMGLHQDEDEAAREVPILSISLGDHARFRLGGLKRNDPTIGFELKSGDVLILEPPLRQAYHGIDRLIAGSSRLLTETGRFNLTLRRVNPA
jgi:alkylated DNA repair protein (DNA oxidative demethylase)